MHVRTLTFIAAASLLALGCAAKRQPRWDATPRSTATLEEGETQASLLEQGDAAWQRRGDEAALRLAIALWEKAVAADPGALPAHDRLARAWYFLADAHARKQGTELQLQTFEICIGAGERALAVSSPAFKQAVTAGKAVEEAIALIDKTGVNAAYWYASCLGKWARAKGFATTLANKDRIKTVMGRVLELDPEFFHGAPDRYFGAFYAVAPGFAGGDMQKSRAHFEKSLARAPYYAGTKVLMAEVYAVKLKDRALFDRLIEEVLAQDDGAHPDLVPETRVEKEKANELKARADDLF